MNKKTKSTYEQFIESLSPERLKAFNAEYRELVLSELMLALIANDEISVQELAKIAEVSPTMVQEMRAGLKKK